MKKILVTGANGLLATNTIHALIAAGYRVKGLLRKTGSYRGVRHPLLELEEGDFTSEDAIGKAITGCDAVIHCAACTGQSAGKEEYHKVNVKGTETLLRTAADNGIRRVVYISSANLFAYGSKDNPGDETSEAIPPLSLSEYAISKIEAQKVVESYTGKIEIITLCPTFMIGPYDSKPSSGRIIMMGYRKPFIFYPPGGKNFVPVQDVASAAVAALDRGIPGEAYILSGENLTYKEFYRLLAERTGGRGIMVKAPEFLLSAAGKTGDFLARHLGIRTEISSVNMKILCTGNYFRCDKAATALGFRCRPVSEAIDEAVCWFIQSGMLKSR